MYFILGFFGSLTAFIQYKKMQPKAPLRIEDAEERAFVEKYKEFVKKEEKKPAYAREQFKI